MVNEFEQTGATTREFTLEFLQQITDNFSEEKIIGRGGYGAVYKGVLENGEEIALKKLHHMPGLDDTQFRNEFNHLMRAQHPNITRLVGYCYNLGHQRFKHGGDYIFALVEERVLCFEYLPGGSLDKHISDESQGLDWHTRFKIIKGVCEGLNYLHNGSGEPIYHLDLKPANILLDKNMIPKIGDFGLSRLFPSAQTYITIKIVGTIGYMPPEYIQRREITSKHDVFSLGVIIVQIVAGDEGYSKCACMSSQEFLEHVQENWGKRLKETMASHTSKQIKKCIKIVLRCVEVDREKRPTIAEIVDELNKVDTAESSPTGKVANFRSKKNSNSERRGRIIFSATYRPPVPFDIFSCPSSPLSIDGEFHLTDGISNNYNGRPIPPAVLKTLVKSHKLVEEGSATDVDVDSGLVFVSERDDGLETLYIATCINGDSKVKVFALVSSMVETFWAVFRYDISTRETVQVTPEGLDAVTPAGISETKVAVATFRQKSRFSDVRVETPYRHIEIFDTNELGLPPVQITQKMRMQGDHYSPFVLDGGARIGYHRCRGDLVQHEDNVPQNLHRLQSPVKDVGLFRLSGMFPTVSKDGSKLAFVDNEFKSVFVADSQGLRIVYEKKAPNCIFSPVWNQNPDKDILYICISTSMNSNKQEIYAICNASGPATGRKVVRLTVGGYSDAYPSSNPDGDRFVFQSTRDGFATYKNLYIMMHGDNEEFGERWETQLMNGKWVDTHCQWSPNADWIVFSSTRDKLAYFCIYLIKATDPMVLIRVMSSGGDLGGHINHPVFSPDGRSIAMMANLTAMSVDPVSLPNFKHGVRNYGVILVVDIHPDNLKKYQDVKGFRFRRITHSRYECGSLDDDLACDGHKRALEHVARNGASVCTGVSVLDPQASFLINC